MFCCVLSCQEVTELKQLKDSSQELKYPNQGEITRSCATSVCKSGVPLSDSQVIFHFKPAQQLRARHYTKSTFIFSAWGSQVYTAHLHPRLVLLTVASIPIPADPLLCCGHIGWGWGEASRVLTPVAILVLLTLKQYSRHWETTQLESSRSN